MAENWTSGPWEHYGSLVYANRPVDGGTICQVSEVRHSHIVEHKEPELGSLDSKEIYANACLIAAAPELYEVLHAIADQLERIGDSRREAPFIEAARKALAKARGEQ